MKCYSFNLYIHLNLKTRHYKVQNHTLINQLVNYKAASDNILPLITLSYFLFESTKTYFVFIRLRLLFLLPITSIYKTHPNL